MDVGDISGNDGTGREAVTGKSTPSGQRSGDRITQQGRSSVEDERAQTGPDIQIAVGYRILMIKDEFVAVIRGGDSR